jgi:rubrerythrin
MRVQYIDKKWKLGGAMVDQSGDKTVAALLGMAITAENATEKLYLGLAQKFSHLPQVADFWQAMMQDEIAHARGLEKIRNTLTPEQLRGPVDPLILQQAQRIARLPVEQNLKSIATLEDAYQLTHDLENSELNTVFEFIVSEFMAEESVKELVMSQLREHIARLSKFPDAFRVMGSTPRQE